MSNKSLADQLGWRYVRDFFSNAWLVRDNMLYYVVSVDSRGYVCRTYDTSVTPSKRGEAVLPHKEVTSFTDFAYPKLGYRNIEHGEIKPSVITLNMNRSVQRGFRLDLLNHQAVNYSNVIDRNSGLSGWDFMPAEERAKVAFFPKWKTWTNGLTDLKDNKYFGFAVNEDIAITISCSHNPEHEFDVLFKGALIGGVTEDGTITFSKERKVNVPILRMFEEDRNVERSINR